MAVHLINTIVILALLLLPETDINIEKGYISSIRRASRLFPRVSEPHYCAEKRSGFFPALPGKLLK